MKGKLEVEECFIISKLKNENVFVVRSFNHERVVCVSYNILKRFINRELKELTHTTQKENKNG